MKKFLLGSLLSLCSMQFIICSDGSSESARYHMIDTISIDDLDALQETAEETNTFDTIQVKPPSPLMIRLRKIGTPILIMLLNARRHFYNAWAWLKDTTLDPICPNCHKRH